jgi:tetratricopeptide (TPR) repeat protein
MADRHRGHSPKSRHVPFGIFKTAGHWYPPAMSPAKVVRFPETKTSGDTWQIGYVRYPAWVEEEGEFYRAWLAIAASAATGLIGSSDLTRCDTPGVELALAAMESLHEVSGTRPALIEVSDLELSVELVNLPQTSDCEVSCRGDLPLLAEPLRAMYRKLAADEPYEAATEVPGVTIEHLRAFADAAEEFRLAAPWRRLESSDIIEVGAPRPAPNVRFACVMGAYDQYGFGFAEERSLLESPADDTQSGFDRLAATSVWSVTFCEPWEVPVREHEAWQKHGLATGPEGLVPSAVQFGPKRRVRRASPKMLAFFEGMFRALAATTEEEMDSGSWSKLVDTSQGPLGLTLSLPDLLAPPETRPESKPPVFNPLRQAAAMDSIHELLKGQDFDSAEEMQAFLDREVVGKKLPPPKIDGPRDQARELGLEAMETPGRRGIALARRALELDPDCVHAHIAIAGHTRDPAAAVEKFRNAMAAAERALGPEIFEEDAGSFWGISSTRPYMEARKGLADVLMANGQIAEAAEHYGELLRLNPNDNQGVRELLAPALMILGDNRSTQDLLDCYPEDFGAAPAFNSALVAFRRRGDTKVARKRLAEALECNPHVADLLLDRAKFPDELPAGYTLGSIDEAAFYFIDAGQAWTESPGALEWLADFIDSDR